jgi:hypothetical protein
MNVLKGVGILERDGPDSLLVWQYPGFDPAVETVFKRHASLNDAEPFRIARHNNVWLYMQLRDVNDSRRPTLQSICICIAVDCYNPEKFNALLEVFHKAYNVSFSPVSVMTLLLSVF